MLEALVQGIKTYLERMRHGFESSVEAEDHGADLGRTVKPASTVCTACKSRNSVLRLGDALAAAHVSAGFH